MKLNLQYISDVIKDDYKTKWNNGDMVQIDSQCGTGKTTFIIEDLLDSLEKDEMMLYLCNRKKLSRDIKRKILVKNGEYDEEKHVDRVLDAMITFGNIKIITYQHLSTNLNEYDLHSFKYIVLDEAHFWAIDASFNHLSHITFFEILRKEYPNSIRIIISATIDEIENAIFKSLHDNLHTYGTGRDYNYLDVNYFKKDEDVIQLIKNDESDDKWLIFVANKKKGELYEKELVDNGIDALFVHAKSNEDGIDSKEKLKNRCLIATKFLDNGISIDDDSVNNIVVTTYDKITFIQEVSRVRVNINDARKINLFIPMLSVRHFNSRLEMRYKRDKWQLDLFMNSPEIFQERYRHFHQTVSSQLFYLDENNDWKVNATGFRRLNLDIEFVEEMIKLFKDDEFAYIKKQLEWLELSNTFDEDNLITNVFDNREVSELEKYLDSIVGKNLYKEEQEDLTSFIMTELMSIKVDADYRTKKLNHKTLEFIIREQLDLEYAISKPKRDNNRKLPNGDVNPNKNKSYISITKLS